MVRFIDDHRAEYGLEPNGRLRIEFTFSNPRMVEALVGDKPGPQINVVINRR